MQRLMDLKGTSGMMVLVVLFLAMGCSATQPPGYMVMLTSKIASTTKRCTGVLVDPTHVLTAKHCKMYQRVVTTMGQEAYAKRIGESRTTDLAVYQLDRILYSNSYAEFAEPVDHMPARVYGLCPYYFTMSPRFAQWVGNHLILTPTGIYKADEWTMLYRYGDEGYLCGGDSGGAFVQNGRVVGIISAVESESYLNVKGSRVYTVSPFHYEQIVSPLEEYEGEG